MVEALRIKFAKQCLQWRGGAVGRATGLIPIIIRHHHPTAPLHQPFKDNQGRESLKPQRQEYTESGDDQWTAAQDEAAFDPNKTNPKEEQETAGKGVDGNPLEFSPANKDISEPKAAAKETIGSGDVKDKSKRSGYGKK